jgi:hypothetical protein
VSTVMIIRTLFRMRKIIIILVLLIGWIYQLPKVRKEISLNQHPKILCRMILLSKKEGSNIIIDLSKSGAAYGKQYNSLTKEEINQLTTYTRKSFFRRCKFVDSGILHCHLDKFFEHIMVNDEKQKLEKTFHVLQCVKDTLSSRRGYSISQIGTKLRGKSIFKFL